MKHLRGVAIVPVLVVVVLAGWFGWPVFEKRVLHREAAKVEAVQQKVEANKAEVTKAEKAIVADAHADVKATGMALADGNVEVAKEFNERADTKLTQVDGGVPIEVVRSLRTIVTKLQSENAAIKEQGRQELASRDAKSDELSKALGKAEAKAEKLQDELKTATDKLQAGFAREQELADNYRYLIRIVVGIGLAYLFIHFILPSLSQEFPASRALNFVNKAVKSITSAHQ